MPVRILAGARPHVPVENRLLSLREAQFFHLLVVDLLPFLTVVMSLVTGLEKDALRAVLLMQVMDEGGDRLVGAVQHTVKIRVVFADGDDGTGSPRFQILYE